MGASRNVRLGTVVCTALLLVLASSFAATAAPKKPFTADVSPHTVDTGSTTTYTLTVTNKTLSQPLGSCNLTAPAGFTLGTVTQQPSSGTATIAGNVLSLRNLSTLPMSSRTVKFTATAPGTEGVYTWAILCRQANNFNPDKPSNVFGLDSANSNLNTTVVSPAPPQPDADVAVTGNSESQDPVTASNTVVYTVTVHNNGPATSGALTLTDSLLGGGSISSIGGTNWTCSGSSTSKSCTHTALASGVDAEPVTVNVVTPDADTVITNRASIAQSGANDPAPANNTLDQTTQVNANTTCASGDVSCGSGTVVNTQLSTVRSCQIPTMVVYICGLVTFQPVATPGTLTFSLRSPDVPENLCPFNLTSSVLVKCDWEIITDDMPLTHPTGTTEVKATCHGSKCPAGLGDAGTIVVYVGPSGNIELLQKCSGPSDTNKCWTRQRIAGNLVITVKNIPPGDPKIAGRCVAGC